MFARLAAAVVNRWPAWLLGWLVVLVVTTLCAPPLDDVVKSGEFAFLPLDAPSRQGERLLEGAWGETVPSRVVIVVNCKGDDDQIGEEDHRFIDGVLAPAIVKLAESMGGLAKSDRESTGTEDEAAAGDEAGTTRASVEQAAADRRSLINDVRTFSDKRIGRLLESKDGRASLVVVELTTEFLNRENRETIEAIEELIRNEAGQPPGTLWSADRGDWHEVGLKPSLVQQRLGVATSGEATVGRDMLRASDESASSTEAWTVVLVVILLVLLYRAPIIALIPMATVVVAVKIAMNLLQLGAQWGIVDLFRGIEVYVTVLCYGAGVDYCFFLIARYREELDLEPQAESGLPVATALSRAVSRVGAALTASAGTVMCGIGMMVFAQFGKFQQAGVGITFGLAVVLAAALTLTPTLLRLTGHLAFWPRHFGASGGQRAGWVAASDPVRRWLQSNPVQAAWDRLAAVLLRWPATCWLVSIALMAPFAAWGAWNYTSLSYGLLSELPQDNPSVRGATEVQKHFPAGNAGPVTLLLRNDSLHFGSSDGRDLVDALTGFLAENRTSLKLADVRSLTHPYGLDGGDGLTGNRFERRIRRKRIQQHYVAELSGEPGADRPGRDRGTTGGVDDLGEDAEPAGWVTRVDVVFDEDPFSRDSIQQLSTLEEHVRGFLASYETEGESEDEAGQGDGEAVGAQGVEREMTATVQDLARATLVLSIGSTASIRDLKTVTDSDQVRIDLLVLAGVYAILLVLLRRPGVSLYLIVGVFFSYFAALGVTFVVFEHVVGSPDSFGGLDWKVPMFLFTILIAVGEDYNIFLMTRIEEEQAEHGMVGGVVEALKKTGSIIAGCGVIMAGTFSSLLAGSLVGMQQLGFALAFGVLLDTLVVMPILVPAWLILLYQGRLGFGFQPETAPGVSPGDEPPGRGSDNSGNASDRDPGTGGLSSGR